MGYVSLEEEDREAVNKRVKENLENIEKLFKNIQEDLSIMSTGDYNDGTNIIIKNIRIMIINTEYEFKTIKKQL